MHVWLPPMLRSHYVPEYTTEIKAGAELLQKLEDVSCEAQSWRSIRGNICRFSRRLEDMLNCHASRTILGVSP